MAQVSKRFIQQEVEQRIMNLFWDSLSCLPNKRKVGLFLDDLLTPTEKLMLAKRFSIAFMLLKGYDYQTINQLLKVSNPTIWSIKLGLQYKGRGYREVIGRIQNQEKWVKFWQSLNELIEDKLPPRAGTNWKEVRKKQWENRRRNQKPF